MKQDEFLLSICYVFWRFIVIPLSDLHRWSEMYAKKLLQDIGTFWIMFLWRLTANISWCLEGNLWTNSCVLFQRFISSFLLYQVEWWVRTRGIYQLNKTVTNAHLTISNKAKGKTWIGIAQPKSVPTLFSACNVNFSKWMTYGCRRITIYLYRIVYHARSSPGSPYALLNVSIWMW